MDDFIINGGIIHLFTLSNRLRMAINMHLALKNNLHFSAKLLEVATLVEVEPDI
jgi:hypothetical protein